MQRNDNSIVDMYFTRSGCLLILVMVLIPSVTLAENSPEVSRFTSQREKSPGTDISTLHSAALPDVEVNVQSGIYKIKAVAVIDAPARNVRYVLTDFKHLYKLNPSITESEAIENNTDGSVNVRTKVNGCASYFCEELNRVEKVSTMPTGEIYAETIPKHGQFKSGQTHWKIKQLGERCEVTYLAELEPDIYIPPVVSKFLVKKAIRQEAQVSFTNLEKVSSNLCLNPDGQTDKPSICN